VLSYLINAKAAWLLAIEFPVKEPWDHFKVDTHKDRQI